MSSTINIKWWYCDKHCLQNEIFCLKIFYDSNHLGAFLTPALKLLQNPFRPFHPSKVSKTPCSCNMQHRHLKCLSPYHLTSPYLDHIFSGCRVALGNIVRIHFGLHRCFSLFLFYFSSSLCAFSLKRQKFFCRNKTENTWILTLGKLSFSP